MKLLPNIFVIVVFFGGLSMAQEKDTLSTSMSGIAYANPAAEVAVVESPVPNVNGDAELSHPIKLPRGRRNMMPELSIQYQGNSGHSWLGTDWQVSAPSISVDTRWGVPRFTAAQESEVYLYNGQQLYPTAHRQGESRTAEKQFWPRVSADFEKIIRHGNTTRSYWWEVMKKDGTRYYFGGKPGAGVVDQAVLRNDTRDVAFWQLVRMEDSDGNYVEYTYEKYVDHARGGSDIYLLSINYTGFESEPGAYQVQFVRDGHLGEKTRPDVNLNYRYGFAQVSDQLLKEIRIRFEDELVRSYHFEYTLGTFSKTLLSAIVERDFNGEEFYRHSFEYFVGEGERKYSDPIPWRVAKDHVKGDIKNPIPGFTGESSMLGASTSSYIAGGAVFTVGPNGDPSSKRFSAGPSAGYASSISEGLLAMVDLNGDGTPDKLFKQDGQLFYRPNLIGMGVAEFGDKTRILGITNFTSSKTRTITVGGEVHAGVAFAGYEYNNSTTTSDTYFVDYNGDNLIDIVSAGTVYFNHIENGHPVFTTNSGDTPSPINAGTLPDLELPRDTTDKNKLFPLHDVVRRWEAPCSGTIRINAPVRLIENLSAPAQAYDKKDGVRIFIQHNARTIWSTTIGPNDFQKKIPDLGNIALVKGDRLYFRVHSIFDGAYDQVVWDPCIEYVTGPANERDVNNYRIRKYQASSDFVLAAPQILVVPQTGTVSIKSKLFKPYLSDDIVLKIVRTRDSVPTIIYNLEVPFTQNIDSSWTIENIAVEAQDELKFIVAASTQVDWAALHWQPMLYYTETDNPDIMVYDSEGTPLLTFCPGLDYTMYNHTIRKAEAWIAPTDGEIVVVAPSQILDPLLVLDSGTPVTISIKSRKGILAKLDYFVNSPVSPLKTDIRQGDTIFVEIHSQNRSARFLQATLTDVQFNGSRLSVSVGHHVANPRDQMKFGPLFRGWGGFVYDGNGARGFLPLDEDTLKIDEGVVDSDIDPDDFDFDNPEEIEGSFESSNPIFTIMIIDGKNQCLNGIDNSTYIKDSIMSSSRNGLDDITDSEPTRPGNGARAPSRITKSNMHSFAGGADAGVNALTAGYSNNTVTLVQDVQDLNGDGYPDILRENGIYYSTPSGGHEATEIDYSLGLHEASSEAIGGSLGGGYVTSSASNSGDTRANNKKANKGKGKQGNMGKKATKATESAENSAGISGEFNYDQDKVVHTWMDMNGDGLVDKITDDGLIYFNRGYSFAEPRSWGAMTIRGGDSYDYGGGLGINYANGSIVAGVSLNRTDNFTEFALEDLNGDGLPDHIESVDPLVVRFNTGAGFAPAVQWFNFETIEEGGSVGESINTAFTACINLLGFRICVNPNFSIGQGVSRQLRQFEDIDNDGQLDMLHSDGDGNLTVQRALVGKTNRLKTVRRPFGGTIELDYDLTQSTYGFPYAKYVLNEIVSSDGFDEQRSPRQKTIIVYEDGALDRFEREPFGFSKILVHEVDPLQDDQVLRTTEQHYYQDHYYNRGLLARTCVKDPSGKKYVESIYEYQMLDPISMDVLTPSQLIHHRRVFPALVSKMDHYYEGMDEVALVHRRDYTYDAYGNVSKMVDHGDGSVEDQLEISYEYHHLSDVYIHNQMKQRLIKAGGEVIRRREQKVDPTGNVIQEGDYLADGSVAVTDKEYDSYGNLTQISYPENSAGERAFQRLTYDQLLNTYAVSTENQFGYVTESEYDLRFGVLTRFTDENQQSFSWTYDEKGRNASYLDPLGASMGYEYTKKYSYHLGANPAYAVAQHHDPEAGNDIETYQFIDGFLRPIQNKMTSVLHQNPGVKGRLSMTVSGRTTYDALGRMLLRYHPTSEPEGQKNTVSGAIDSAEPIRYQYDVLDRITEVTWQDGSREQIQYDLANDRDGFTQLRKTTFDPLENQSATYTDVRGRIRAKTRRDAEGDIWNSFKYNAIDELVRSVNHFNYHTTYTYDQFGRLVEKRMPDQDPINYYYDLAGNLTHKITPNIRENIPNGGMIKYSYEYDRLKRIDYPKNIQNAVIYHYGSKDAKYNRVGRLWLIEDASGGQEFFFDSLGNVIKNYRTIIVDQTNIATYVTAFEYDPWHRIKKVIYPDNEIVHYFYDEGGSLTKVEGTKEGHTYSYIEQMGYDQFGDLVYQKLGNGVESVFNYEPDRRRISKAVAFTTNGAPFMNNSYQYDAIGNVTDWICKTDELLGLGGTEDHHYQYDQLYRLTKAKGSVEGQDQAAFDLTLTYDQLYNIRSKTERIMTGSGRFDSTANDVYAYDTEKPHQFIEKNSKQYDFDGNGNLEQKTSELTFDHRQLIWDEEDRLMAVVDNGLLHKYTYDAHHRRVIKSSGQHRGVFLDGAPVGITQHDDNFTVYVNPFLTIEKDRFMKHYYIGSERFLSKVGTGKFVHDLLPTYRALYAGNLDFSQRQLLIQQTLNNYYAGLGIPPGPPTLYGYYGHPDLTGSPLPQLDTLNAFTAPPANWPLPIGRPDTTGPPGQPVWLEGDTILGQPGHGFQGDDVFTEINQFYYHTDHLGSTSFVTDLVGEVRQYVAYMPFGKPFLQQQKTPESIPYLFNGKELDEKTGLAYYGARYLDTETLLWQNVDPLAEKYPAMSPYAYVGQNPVNYIDPDGKKIAIHYRYKNKNRVFKFGSRDIPNNRFVKATLKSFAYLKDSQAAVALIDRAHRSGETINIRYTSELGNESFLPIERRIKYNPRSALRNDGGDQTPALGLLHELAHAVEFIENENRYLDNALKKLSHYDDAEERRVIRGVERQAAIELGEGTRRDHRGQPFESEGPTSTRPRRVKNGKNTAGNRNFTMGRKGNM